MAKLLSHLYFKVFTTLLLKVSAALTSFLLTFLVAKNLNIEDSGLYFFINNLLMLLTAFTTFGLQSVALKEYSLNAHAGTGFSYIMTIVVTSLFVSIPLIVILENLLKIPSMFGVAIWLLSISAIQVVTMQFQAVGDQAFSVLSNLMLVNVILCLVLLIFGMDSLDNFIAIQAIVSLCIFLFFLLFLLLKYRAVYEWNYLKDISKGKEFLIINILSQVLMLGGLVISKINITISDYSMLSVAYRIALVMNFLIVSINFIFIPRLLKIRGSKPDLAFRILNYISVLTFLSSIVILLVVIAFSDKILLLFGQEYIDSKSVLVIFMVSQMSVSALGAYGQFLTLSGYEKILRNTLVFSSIMIVLLSYFLSKAFGIVGSAAAICIVTVAQNLYVLYFAIRNRKAIFTSENSVGSI